jgi:hypothetical protein
MASSELTYTMFWLSVYLLIFIGLVLGIFSAVAAWFRRQHELKYEYNLTFLQLKVPNLNEIEIKAAEQLFSSLTGFRRGFFDRMFKGDYRISFEIVSKITGIYFYVVVPDEIVSLVEKQINGAYAEAEIDVVKPSEIWDRGDYTTVEELRLSGPSYYPIKNYEDLKIDALSTITSSMSKLREDEVLALQLVLKPAIDTWRHAGNAFVQKVKNAGNNPEKKVNVDTSFLEGVEKKVAKQGFDVAIRIVSIGKDKFSTDAHARNLMSSFEQFTDVKYNKFKRVHNWNPRQRIDNFIYRRLEVLDVHIPIFDISLYRSASVLNIAEMATVFHLPNKDVQTPNILWLQAKRSPAPTNVPDNGLYLGKSIFRGVETKIHMLEKDRTRHFYIIGQTGTGKSEFMKSLALQDIKNGEGLAFIDPHGSDIDDILQKIPPERADDVILFDVSDFDRPMGLNLLEAESVEQRHMIINAFIALLYKLYDPNHQGIMGPLLERSIRNVMLTAMEDPEATMVDVLRLLIDPKYIQKFIPLIKDPLVKKYWTDEVAKTSESRKSETMGYFVSKFDRFVTDKTMRNILGQPKSSFQFSKIMSEKKILLVDLSKGKIGEENSNFIGLLLVPRILGAALARASMLGKQDFPNFFLYVDEFQNFATPDFAVILSEARKYKLNLVVAHQFISQLDEEIKKAIFGNVGTMTVFRIGADDGEYLEQQFAPVFTKKDLSNNPNGSCYAKILVNGHPTPPFSMAVDWDAIMSTQKSPEIAEYIRKNSRLKYGTAVEEVEEYINMRSGMYDPEPPKPEPSKLGRIPF